MGDELRTRNFHRTHALQVRRCDLGVDQWKVPSLQGAAERYQCDLGSVGRAAEHRFAEEHAPDRDAVDSADQPAVAIESLDRMRVAELMKGPVRIEHSARDP